MDLTRADEGRHDPGVSAAWEEWWDFDWAAPDGTLGGYARLALRPATGLASYWAAIAGPGRPPALVADDAVRVPRGRSLEVRADALWADHVCETPGDHWTLGAEAFAVALDDPVEAWGAARGERVPFGIDLEWETEGPARPLPGGGYELPCLVTGEVVVGDERVEVEAWGWRRHAWGDGTADRSVVAVAWAGGRLDDGTWVSGPLAGPRWPGDSLPGPRRLGVVPRLGGSAPSSAGAEPAEPAGGGPIAVEPGETEPAAVDRVAVEPAGAEPAAVEPARAEPAAVEPAGTEVAAVEAAGAEPARGEPAAVEPVGEPARGEPITVQPVGVAPVGVGPVGVEPVGVGPVGVEPVGGSVDVEEVEVDPVAFAPVLSAPSGGPVVRVARALCRLRSAAGVTGVGWAGWTGPAA